MRPRFEVQFSVTVRDAGPEDVAALLGQLAAIAGRDVIQITAPAGIHPALPSATPALAPVQGRRAYSPTWRMMSAGEKKAVLLEALQAEDWIVDRAAARLGMSRETVRHWARVLEIRQEAA